MRPFASLRAFQDERFLREDRREAKECRMIIKHNMSAVNAHRSLKFNVWEVDKTMMKLSSGERINRSGDDPSGLAVSEKMRTQIQGLRQAERNTEDGMSFIQTAEGYLQQTADIIQRMRVLAIQSANGIYSPQDRQLIQVEVSQLVDEVDRIASQAEFNRFPLLQGEYARNSVKASMWFHMGPNQYQRERVFIGTMTATSLGLRLGENKPISISTPAKANDVIGFADAALGKLMKQRADLGAYYNRLETTAKGLMNAYENVQASESRIRDADMAEEMVTLTTRQILTQTGIAMLAHAGVRPQGILQLLR
jgi:flagellin